MRLRLATLHDLPAICVLGQMMHAESSFAALDYDLECVKATLSDLLKKKQLVLVAEDTNGEVIGGLLGKVTPCWFGKDMVANELGLFIHPAHRGGMLAASLIRVFVAWARLAGARQIRPGVMTGCALAERLYERLGFRRCGATFVMEGV